MRGINARNLFLRLSHRDPGISPTIASEHEFKSRKGLPERANPASDLYFGAEGIE
jgi:hypothetical protein